MKPSTNIDARAVLDQLLRTGRRMAGQGRDAAQRRLNVPPPGAGREALYSGLGKGAAAGGLLALLLGSRAGRRLFGGLFKAGGLAALGGLAYQAWQDWRAREDTAVSVPEAGAGDRTPDDAGWRR